MASDGKITKKELAQTILKYADRDDVNPIDQDMGACLYTSEDGKKHCIIGQALVDLGYAPPEFGNTDSALGLLSYWADHEVAFFARKIQEDADNVGRSGNIQPRTWREVVFLNRFELEEAANS